MRFEASSAGYRTICLRQLLRARPEPSGRDSLHRRGLLLKQQLIVVRRPRQRAPPLTASDRLLFGCGSLFLSPGRIRKVAIDAQEGEPVHDDD